MTAQPLDRADLLADLAAGDHRCTARSKRTGERCKLPSMLGGNVCRAHGGAAPQTRAKAQRRLAQAADVLVQRLLNFALDGDTPDHVALQAIRDALDRAGLGAKQSVELSAKEPEPWEEMFMDFARVSRERHARLKRGEPELSAPAHDGAEPMEIVDAELVDDGPADRLSAAEDECASAGQPAKPPPHFAEPSAPPSRELATLEDATAEAGAANRRARVVRVRRAR